MDLIAQRLKLLEECKRRAEMDDAALRQIFDEVCRLAGDAGHHLSYAAVESAMRKSRRVPAASPGTAP